VQTFNGTIANRGLAIGPAYHFNRALIVAEERKLEDAEIGMELRNFENAISRAKEEIEKITRIAHQKAGTHGSAIFEVQKMILEDQFFLNVIRERIMDELRSAAYVVDTEFTKQLHIFEMSDSPLMRERADDIEDIKQRLLRHLLKKDKILSRVDKPSIVIAEFLTPADAILFARSELLGFAMDGGGATSHVSILSRSLGLPSIVALHNAAQHIATGDLLILDAEEGNLIISPDSDTLRQYEERLQSKGKKKARLEFKGREIARPETTDGHPVSVTMNMELIGEEAIKEAEEISEYKGKNIRGLGLVRTEHFLTANDEIPSEAEQTMIYTDLAKRFHPAPITIRTFDIGGDKFIGGGFREKNPFLGWRGIRISLDEPDTFSAQIRSILRASAQKNVRLLLPLVTSLSELDRTLELVQAAKKELALRDEPFDDDIPIGVMIEVPAAAILAEHFAARCDFLSIGSNDLTQYTLAVDRGNEFIVHLFDELHPAVLQLIHKTISAAHIHKKSVSLCGEMGAKNLALPVLVGLGIDEISVSPVRVGMVASLINKLNHAKTRSLVKRILETATTAAEAKEMVTDHLEKNGIMEEFLAR
jgi:phosphotransferase system enzyme I (PtsI)